MQGSGGVIAFAFKGQAGTVVRALRAAEQLQLSQKTSVRQIVSMLRLPCSLSFILLCCRNTHLCIFLIQAHDLCAWTSPTGALELNLQQGMLAVLRAS